jgi:hypothetical protein
MTANAEPLATPKALGIIRCGLTKNSMTHEQLLVTCRRLLGDIDQYRGALVLTQSVVDGTRTWEDIEELQAFLEELKEVADV